MTTAAIKACEWKSVLFIFISGQLSWGLELATWNTSTISGVFWRRPYFQLRAALKIHLVRNIWLDRKQLETIRVTAVLFKKVRDLLALEFQCCTSIWIIWGHWLKMLIPSAETLTYYKLLHMIIQTSAYHFKIASLIIKKKFKMYLLMQTASLSKAVRAANLGKYWLYISTNPDTQTHI